MRARVVTGVLTVLVGLAAPTWAMHEAAAGDLENLRRRIEMLERHAAAPGEPVPVAAALGEWTSRIKFSGLIEVEGSYNHVEGGAETSDLTLATAQLGIEAPVTERAGAHLVLLYEEGGSDAVAVDEAAVNLTLVDRRCSLAAGRQYLPFGHYSSHLVSNPLTLELGETIDTALVLRGGLPEMLEIRLGVFNGQADRAGHDDRMDSWVAALEVMPAEGLACGVSYLSDLAESDLGLVHDDLLLGNVYDDAVPAAAGFISLELGPVAVEGEYLGALDNFAPAIVALGTDLTGSRPQAWNAELAVSPAAGWEIAARYEGARDFRNDLQRYGAVIACEIFHKTVAALECLRGDAKGAGNDPEHTVKVQLALSF